MDGLYNWAWIEAEAAHTAAAWNACARGPALERRPYSPREQRRREKAYDAGLTEVEDEARRSRGLQGSTRRDRAETRERMIAAFAHFCAQALDLEAGAIALLTHDFLPVGTQLAQWARRFDPALSMPDIIQACRNAWTACGLQPLLGQPIALTPSIAGYSLLYPYSDNFLDREDVSGESKLRLSRRFRDRLRGEAIATADERERALWALVEQIEGQYPRATCPQVFACLLAIHRAQEQSLAQLGGDCPPAELLRLSCEKGGSSVLADACLAQAWLTPQQSRFAFAWGVLLQLGDDLQDIDDDRRRGSWTLFSQAAVRGTPLDDLVVQLLRFSEHVGAAMDRLPHGTPLLKGLLRMSWQSLILMAVAQSHSFFSARFLEQAERWSPFRFGFLRERRERLIGRQGLYAMLFDLFLEVPEGELPMSPPAANPIPVSSCAPRATEFARQP
jgi:hypothetical protein